MHLFGTSDPDTGQSDPARSEDFGFGNQVGHSPGSRLINSDGTFNVVRKGKSAFAPYQQLVEMSWPRFIALTLVLYFGCCLFFAAGFYLIGPENLSGIDLWESEWEKFLGCLYLSVQTFTTVGYGTISPISVGANTWAAILALFGWIALAIMTGLFYGRFSRPARMVVFSESAIITPLGDGRMSLQFRIANKRDNNLINLRARITLTYLDRSEAGTDRKFTPLQLQRDFVPLFPLNWTLAHFITEDSPLHQWTEDEFKDRAAEILVIVEGYDRTFAQPIFVTNSYTRDEIKWHMRFEPMYEEQDKVTHLHLDRISSLAPIDEQGES
jgi:inward rectifier potassium channel